MLLSFKALKNLVGKEAVNRIGVTKKLRRYIFIELIKDGAFTAVYKREGVEAVTLKDSSDAEQQALAYVRSCLDRKSTRLNSSHSS